MSQKDLLFTPEKPHFSIMIQDSVVYQGKLMIPEKFVRKHGSDLQSPVKLKICRGDLWKVELEKSDGVIWLKRGLKEFMAHYSIVGRYCLVFKYKKKSKFKVTIFDASGTEIDYKIVSRKDEASPGKNKELEKNASKEGLCFELAGEGFVRKKRKDKLPTACPRPQKLRRTNSCDETGKSLKLGQSSRQGLEGKLNTESAGTSVKKTPRSILRKEQADSECFERANGFEFDKPFFKVIMRSSYVTRSLVIPVAFARKYLTMRHDLVTLQLSDGRTWSVKFNRKASTAYKNAQFDGGWLKFVRDNHLKVGDVCVFELCDQISEILLKVAILRVNETTSSPDPPGILDNVATENYRPPSETVKADEVKCVEIILDDDIKTEAFYYDANEQGETPGLNCGGSRSCSRICNCLEAANEFTSRKPNSILKIVRASHLKPDGNMYLPSKFFRNLIEPEDQKVEVKCGVRLWLMKIKFCSDRAGYIIRAGWRTLAHDNSLKVGDVCAFELFKRKDGVRLKVSLFRHKS